MLTLAVPLALGLSGFAHAQPETTFVIPRVPAGTVVRVWTSKLAEDTHVGILERTSDDSLRLRLQGAMLSVPMAGVRRIDTGVQRTPGEAALRGFTTGLCAAAVFDLLVFGIPWSRGEGGGTDPILGITSVVVTATVVISSTLSGLANPGAVWTTVYRR